jgi:hypothetical protein
MREARDAMEDDPRLLSPCTGTDWTKVFAPPDIYETGM